MADGIFVEQIQGEMILLDGSGNRYMALNETGAAILAAVDDGCGIDDIVERLVDGWEVASTDARTFATSFIDELETRGVLVRSTG